MRPDLKLNGIQDTMASIYPEVSDVRDLSTIREGSLDSVTAFAVEHMLDLEMTAFVQSVIIYGAGRPLKELNRMLPPPAAIQLYGTRIVSASAGTSRGAAARSPMPRSAGRSCRRLHVGGRKPPGTRRALPII